jgi:hypothetical protein
MKPATNILDYQTKSRSTAVYIGAGTSKNPLLPFVELIADLGILLQGDQEEQSERQIRACRVIGHIRQLAAELEVDLAPPSFGPPLTRTDAWAYTEALAPDVEKTFRDGPADFRRDRVKPVLDQLLSQVLGTESLDPADHPGILPPEIPLRPADTWNPLYPLIGLCEELGEYFRATSLLERQKEAGDVAWHIAQLATEMELDLAPDPIYGSPEGGFTGEDAWECIGGSLARFIGGTYRSRLIGHRGGGMVLDALSCIWFHVVDTPLNFSADCPDVVALLNLNLRKLDDRKNRNVIRGDGDDR